MSELSLEVADIRAVLILFSSGLQFLRSRGFVAVLACVKFAPWNGQVLVPAAAALACICCFSITNSMQVGDWQPSHKWSSYNKNHIALCYIRYTYCPSLPPPSSSPPSSLPPSSHAYLHTQSSYSKKQGLPPLPAYGSAADLLKVWTLAQCTGRG